MSTAPVTSTGEAQVFEPQDGDPSEPALLDAAAGPEGVSFLFTTADFFRMIELDVFPREARVGLWDGQVYEKIAKKFAHAVAGSKLVSTLLPVLPPGWCLWPENPIAISPEKAPLPDMSVLRGRAGDYGRRHPEPADVGLVIELADSSLRFDLGVKLAAYAAARLATYWVINLKDDVIQVFENPVPAERRYASTSTIRRGESVSFLLDETRVGPIAASDLLPD